MTNRPSTLSTPPAAKRGFDRAQAEGFAAELVRLLRPACARIEIAGSIRRCAERSSDIEIVAIPHFSAPPALMFPSAVEPEDQLAKLLDRLIRDLPTLQRDTDRRPAWGPRFKKLRFRGMPVDLFCCDPATWASTLAIRTGPADFSRLCVTSIEQGGAMPAGIKQAGGQLWDCSSPGGSKVLDTPEEEDWFGALGLPCWPPSERSALRLERFLKSKGH